MSETIKKKSNATKKEQAEKFATTTAKETAVADAEKYAAISATEETESNMVENTVVVEQEKPKAPKRKPLPKVDLNELVEVESCFHGDLNFVSAKTGRRANWGEFGSVDYLSVEDLMSMRNTQPAFFKNNWIILVGENAQDVFDYLQLGRFYKNYRSLDDFTELFSMSPEDLKAALDDMNAESKENVARHAYALIQEGELDSVRIIEVIENSTGFDLRG